MKAGKITAGADEVLRALRGRKGRLLILAEDMAPKDRDFYERLSRTMHIPFCVFGEKEKLGRALGKGVRAAVLITDQGFARAIFQKIKDQENEKGGC